MTLKLKNAMPMAACTAMFAVLIFAASACGKSRPHETILGYNTGVLISNPAAVNTGNYKRMLEKNGKIPVKNIVLKSEPIRASKWRVYEALTDAKTFQAFSRVPAGAKSNPSSIFLNEYALFGGFLKALTFHVDAGPDKIEIHQLWNGSAPLPDAHPTHAKKLSMPKNYFILTTFTITETAAGSILMVQQSGVPEYSAGFISVGWRKFYLGPIRAFFNKAGGS